MTKRKVYKVVRKVVRRSGSDYISAVVDPAIAAHYTPGEWVRRGGGPFFVWRESAFAEAMQFAKTDSAFEIWEAEAENPRSIGWILQHPHYQSSYSFGAFWNDPDQERWSGARMRPPEGMVGCDAVRLVRRILPK